MKVRIIVASLSLSAAALVGLVNQEGYTDKAIIPTKGDVPTLGFGSTVYENGKPVSMGDKITPQRALILAQKHISKDEEAFRESIEGVALYQYEYDAYIDFTYQYGIGKWNKSSMRQYLLKEDYPKACAALLKYKFAAGYDCSTPGNTRCYGVWERQLKRHAQCMGAQ
jgi:GH24 family phage-related lysozyme (muramidase)